MTKCKCIYIYIYCQHWHLYTRFSCLIHTLNMKMYVEHFTVKGHTIWKCSVFVPLDIRQHWFLGQTVCRWTHGDISDSHLIYSCYSEAKFGEHDEWEDNKTLWHGMWAGEEGLGGSLHCLHGREGHACSQSAVGGKKAIGSVPPVPLCSRDRWPGNGE